jgi:hypothetical protein
VTTALRSRRGIKTCAGCRRCSGAPQSICSGGARHETHAAAESSNETHRLSENIVCMMLLASSERGDVAEHLYHATLCVPWQPAPRPVLLRMSSASLRVCCVSKPLQRCHSSVERLYLCMCCVSTVRTCAKRAG